MWNDTADGEDVGIKVMDRMYFSRAHYLISLQSPNHNVLYKKPAKEYLRARYL